MHIFIDFVLQISCISFFSRFGEFFLDKILNFSILHQGKQSKNHHKKIHIRQFNIGNKKSTQQSTDDIGHIDAREVNTEYLTTVMLMRFFSIKGTIGRKHRRTCHSIKYNSENKKSWSRLHPCKKIKQARNCIDKFTQEQEMSCIPLIIHYSHRNYDN